MMNSNTLLIPMIRETMDAYQIEKEAKAVRNYNDTLADFQSIASRAEWDISHLEKFQVSQASLNECVDSYISEVHAIEIEIADMEEVRDNVKNKLRKLEVRLEKIKAEMMAAMKQNKVAKIRGKKGSLTMIRSMARVSIDTEAEIPMEYKKISTTLNCNKIRESLVNGFSVPGASLKPAGMHIKIGR